HRLREVGLRVLGAQVDGAAERLRRLREHVPARGRLGGGVRLAGLVRCQGQPARCGQPAEEGAGRQYGRGGQSRSPSPGVVLRSGGGEWRAGKGFPARETMATARRMPFHSARRKSASARFSSCTSAAPSRAGARSISTFSIVPAKRNGAT